MSKTNEYNVSSSSNFYDTFQPFRSQFTISDLVVSHIIHGTHVGDLIMAYPHKNFALNSLHITYLLSTLKIHFRFPEKQKPHFILRTHRGKLPHEFSLPCH